MVHTPVFKLLILLKNRYDPGPVDTN